MSNSLSDLVLGELQQMNGGKKKDPFESYLKKTYNKTASLMANSCQAVAHIAVDNCNHNFLTQGWFILMIMLTSNMIFYTFLDILCNWIKCIMFMFDLFNNSF